MSCDENHQRLLSKATVAVFNTEYSALFFSKVVYVYIYIYTCTHVYIYIYIAYLPCHWHVCIVYMNVYVINCIFWPTSTYHFSKIRLIHPIVSSSGRLQCLGCIHIGRMNPCVAWREMKVLVTYPVALLVDKYCAFGDRVDLPWNTVFEPSQQVCSMLFSRSATVSTPLSDMCSWLGRACCDERGTRGIGRSNTFKYEMIRASEHVATAYVQALSFVHWCLLSLNRYIFLSAWSSAAISPQTTVKFGAEFNNFHVA